MNEKKENAQLGARMDPELKKWIQETADQMKITQGEFLAMMRDCYVENDATVRFPESAAQIRDVHHWARSLEDAFLLQVKHGHDADERAQAAVQKLLERKDDVIAEQLQDIKDLKEQKKALEETARRAEDLQRDLDAARARVGEVEADAKQRMDDLRTTNDSLMGDKKRLEAEVQKCQEQIGGMQAAVASYEAMRNERDTALVKVEEERKASQETQKQAVEATRQAMQEQINAVNERLHEAVVAQAAAQAEANNLKEFKVANDCLHETVGEQKAKIAMLEDQVAALDKRAIEAERKAVEWSEKNRAQTEKITELQALVDAMKKAATAGADGQTAIEGV